MIRPTTKFEATKLAAAALFMAATAVIPPQPVTAGTPDAVTASVSISDTEVTENGIDDPRHRYRNDRKVTIRFEVSDALGVASTVTWRTVDGTAIAGQHYTADGGTITLQPRYAQRTWPVTIELAADDLVPEPDRTFGVEIVAVTGALTVAQRFATVTIRDDDHVPTLSVSGPTAVDETDADQVFQYTFTLDHAYSAAIRLRVGAYDGSATGRQSSQPFGDFVNFHNQKRNTSVPLIFWPGDTTRTVRVIVRGDDLDESDETFSLRFSSQRTHVQPVLPDPNEFTTTIVDDD